jgi:lipopolysaccharide export system ATP-binding protein
VSDRVFAAEGIGRSFGRRTVLSGASMWASAGRISVILGLNGTGKTTLIRCALGLIQPEYGTVRYEGRTTTRPRLFRLAREGLYYLPTERLLSRRFSLRAQVTASVRLRERYPSLADRAPGIDPTARVESADRLGLSELLDRSPHTFSGGEMRRAEIAVALARMPRCLIADEPLHGIGPTDTEIVSKELRRLADRGCAVIVTGHEVMPLLELADDVTWLTTGGSTHGLGTPAEARAHHQFRREYLGTR